LVLAGDMGPRREGPQTPAGVAVPLLVAAERPLTEWVAPSLTRAGDFVATKVARDPAQPAAPTDIALAPFYRTHRRTYSAYFDVLTPAEFDARALAAAAERERMRKLEAATVAFVQPGETQRESEFNYKSDPPNRAPQRSNGRASRGGTGWFSYALPVDNATDMAIVVTYLNELGLEPAGGNFQILVEGVEVARFQPDSTATGFFDVVYAIPPAVLTGKTKATIRFQAAANGRIAPVFGVRMIRSKEVF